MLKELIKIYTTNQNDVQLFSLLTLGLSSIALVLYIIRVLSRSERVSSKTEKHNNIVVASTVFIIINLVFTGLPLFHTYIHF